jgi:hypothetical protein
MNSTAKNETVSAVLLFGWVYKLDYWSAPKSAL